MPYELTPSAIRGMLFRGRGFSLAAGAGDQLGGTIPFSPLRAALHEPLGKLAANDHRHDVPETPVWWIG